MSDLERAWEAAEKSMVQNNLRPHEYRLRSQRMALAHVVVNAFLAELDIEPAELGNVYRICSNSPCHAPMRDHPRDYYEGGIIGKMHGQGATHCEGVAGPLVVTAREDADV